MKEQIDMFGDMERPKGLSYIPDFISAQEEEFLLGKMQDIHWKTFEMHGVTARRKIAQYGLEYAFTSRSGELKDSPPPEFLKKFLTRTAKFIKVHKEDIVQILFSYYPPGAPIGWHRDAPMFEDVMGISLGSSCVMKFRKYDDHKIIYKQELENRSAYLLHGPARWDWQHHIPPVKVERYSITFRTLKKPK